jgi:hypothetical protein
MEHNSSLEAGSCLGSKEITPETVRNTIILEKLVVAQVGKKSPPRNSSGVKTDTYFKLICLFLDPDDGSDLYLRNVS